MPFVSEFGFNRSYSQKLTPLRRLILRTAWFRQCSKFFAVWVSYWAKLKFRRKETHVFFASGIVALPEPFVSEFGFNRS